MNFIAKMYLFSNKLVTNSLNTAVLRKCYFILWKNVNEYMKMNIIIINDKGGIQMGFKEGFFWDSPCGNDPAAVPH